MKKPHFIPYIGGKYKLVGKISDRLHATGKKCLVDVFGGSGAVTLHSGFKKRVYNDINGDIVNLFRVMADSNLRPQLLRRLKWTPPSRQVFEEDGELFKLGGYSFTNVECSVDRARMTFYRHIFCFGGKTRCGGFAISFKDCKHVKEVSKYHNVLKSFAVFGRFFSHTVIENLDFADLIEKYGDKEHVVIFADPPYPDFSMYYSDNLSACRHRELASLLIRTPAPVVCTFYDHPLIRELYPAELWLYKVEIGNKNSIQGGNKSADELILIKKEGVSADLIERYTRVIEPQMNLLKSSTGE